ncbi:MAG: YggS family pyridoxal phosphate-dependent enzyme [Verrucomicrobiales bacterium]
MGEIANRLAVIRQRINDACERSGRQPGEVTLLAVSKRFPASSIRAALEAGQLDFGESRQQEGAEKVTELPDAIRWHFIGKLQRNKVRKVLQDFGTIHSVDSMKLALHISRIADELGISPRVYLEVNGAGEIQKGGFAVDELKAMFSELRQLPAIKIEGLMAIPPVEGARQWFRGLRELRDELVEASGESLPGLSMGMSRDFEVAIEEGSTVIRVGSAIFGQRPA